MEAGIGIGRAGEPGQEGKMKYGMRERISGAVILIALAVIFVPMLFDEPAPREERPQPMLTIEQPVPVERRDVPDPEPPASLGQIQPPEMVPVEPEGVEPREPAVPDERVVDEAVPEVAQDTPATPEDPIADLARAASERVESRQAPAEPEPAPAPSAAAPAGEWAVQVGSFGEPANAERLEARLKEQGFSAYRRLRDNNLTTVYVGPYDSSEAGERAMGELKEQANLQGLLVRVRE
jgi:DedD protein